ncbi:hypothetical protein SORDD16_01854 [Streptococcus oralis]|uniref:Uncharacterized protein n=1 Tax=Streptococcus oralis TaxID=1303 RepID=A0A139P4J8_STROR|nr:hypothetical protein SORDD16_01854 [Streptococcus oralis]
MLLSAPAKALPQALARANLQVLLYLQVKAPVPLHRTTKTQVRSQQVKVLAHQ